MKTNLFMPFLVMCTLFSCNHKSETNPPSTESTPQYEKNQIVNIDVEKSSLKWFAKKTDGQHEGLIALQSGSFEIKNNEIVSGEFIVDMTTITCSDIKNEKYNQKLVDHLKSEDFFDVNQYPIAILKIKKSSKFVNGKTMITADMTIKNKTNKIKFELNKSKDFYSAELDIDRSKFDVRYGSESFFDNLGDNVIDDIFRLTIQLKNK